MKSAIGHFCCCCTQKSQSHGTRSHSLMGPFPSGPGVLGGFVSGFVLCLFVGSRQVAQPPSSSNLVVVVVVVELVVDPDDVLPFCCFVYACVVKPSALFLPAQEIGNPYPPPPIFSISSLPPFFPSSTLVFVPIHHQILRHRHVPGHFLPDFSAGLVIHESKGQLWPHLSFQQTSLP